MKSTQVLFAVLLCAPLVRAASPAEAPAAARAQSLMTRDAEGMPGMEVTMSTVQYAPGGSSPRHSHNAQVFVYVLEGHVIMQVEGGPLQTLGPGETFYETPTDVHTVSANASATEPAKLLVVMLRKKESSAPKTPAR